MDPLKDSEILSDQLFLQSFLEVVEYRVARSREELEQAYSLVYKEYLKRGYVKESSAKLKISLFNALPQTATFVAAIDEQVIATASVIPDSPLGLPMDRIYHEELCLLRQRKIKLCEVSMLTSDTEFFQNGTSMMLNTKKLFFIFNLFKIIFDYTRFVLRFDCISIVINPKHNLTYNYLLFQELGGLKRYEALNGAPALAKYLDLHTVKGECQRRNKEGIYQMFFVKETPPESFSGRFVLSPLDLKYFFVEKTHIFPAAAPIQLAYIKNCYPAYDFSKILA